MNSKSYLIFGVSKGLGKAITEHLPSKQDTVYGVSRSKPDYLDNILPNKHWVSADLSNPVKATTELKQQIGNQKIDYLIYNVGIWEHNAFSEDYNFNDNTQEEILNMINTNISSCILNIQAFIDNLKLSDNAKIILIGSTWGLDNHNGKEVTFSATKFALRGIIHSLRENLREDSIGVSILNLGYLATEYGCDEPIETIIEQSNGELIPLQDVLQAIRFITSTSKASCVKEINMPAMKDSNM
ncbi:SDR family oxidoreductase [Myroides marinus]|uniref:SDR family NAD(P)-dependent oxidoreductase n=1 Tax=Myroides marinus TaxID=703342 RepID=UPI002575375C|nr:SDR family oxidoreductase [Myroides marinus]MDM1351115.1 SDR family oxidoreductase [Myroides marinus]MDM1358369.1 SDR family oxidoreductase [Myroides marinus]